ncbi:ATP-binding protein [Roseivirga sp. E12]|uniref:ATP-binding protein n=1 Tax=Roseivirga sp. E12 TaxID=2819237 RepID=UPI001ABCA5E5|nr:ATP-binding protein [Roseivirga sp. E12]MBO3698813.1 response regulator [Roseivirga sp. E12]
MFEHISRIERIKLEMISPLSQVVIFHTNGEVLDTCDTLIKVEAKKSVFDQFDFLKSIEEVFPGLPVGEKLVFDVVEWNEGAEGLFALEFVKFDDTRIQWVILNKTKDQEQITKVQQERNDSAINEEFLEIQRKYLEMEKALLDYKNEELHRVQKFKEQFFAEVSHEMRTPLNSISGLIDLLRSSQSEGSTDYLAALKATSNHLNAIINDVLDLSKIEAGKFSLSLSPFHLKKTIRNIVAGFEHSAREKGVKLNLEIDSTIPVHVDGDSVRFSQVIYNLLSNALKFTDRGHVSLAVTAERSSDSIQTLAFTIRDTGKGMSDRDIEGILEPYAQVEGQDYHQFGGTGLGLGIAQQLIQLMGGRLGIESEEGKGTTMTFQLEFQRSTLEPVQEEDKSTTDLSHLEVLFVEDDEIGTVLLKGIASEMGIKGTFVKSIEAFELEAQERPFDFIVTDVNLPDGDMISAIEGLRSRSGLNQSTKVIFLSGDDKEILDGLQEIENHDYLMKPIATDSLIALLCVEEPQVTINLDNLRTSTQGDGALMKEIIETILETLPLELVKLEKAQKEKDQVLLRKVLHKINPSISYLGNDRLINQRKALYTKVLDQEPINNELRNFCDAVTVALGVLQIEKGRL